MSLTMVLVPAAAALAAASSEAVLAAMEHKQNNEMEDIQVHTYNNVINNLPENMYVESEEVLDDETVLITLNVE